MFRRSILFVSLLFLVTGALPTLAQNFGRVVLVVKDAKGVPVQGVEVTATCDELPNFQEKAVTSKKGRATISVIDATKVYKFHIEYENYPPLDVPIKPEIRQTITREVTLSAGGGSPSARGGDGDEEIQVTFTPAQRAFNEGVEALKTEDYEGAKLKFMEAMEKDPEMGESYSAIAGIYLYQEDWQNAVTAANRFIELSGDNPRAYRILYEAHQQLGNAEQAREAFEALKRLDQGGDTVAMLYNEGVNALQVGDNRTAKTRFLEALELNPELDLAYKSLAIAHILLKEYPEAVAMAEKSLAVHPQDKVVLRIRYDAYRALGDEAKMAEAMEALAAVDPTALADEFFTEAQAAFNQGDMATAIAGFERVLAVDPSFAEAHYQLGLAYVNQDEKAKARQHLQSFIDLAPDHPDAAVAKEMLSYLG